MLDIMRSNKNACCWYVTLQRNNSEVHSLLKPLWDYNTLLKYQKMFLTNLHPRGDAKALTLPTSRSVIYHTSYVSNDERLTKLCLWRNPAIAVNTCQRSGVVFAGTPFVPEYGLRGIRIVIGFCSWFLLFCSVITTPLLFIFRLTTENSRARRLDNWDAGCIPGKPPPYPHAT